MSPRTYRLTITRVEPNPEYLSNIREQHGSYDQRGLPTPMEIETREMFVTVTEDELNTIKQALIKVWT